MKRRSSIFLIFCVLVILTFTLCACSEARKPLPDNKNAPNERADKLAYMADSVDGVKKATVVISGKMAYVGLDLDADIEEEQTNEVEKMVMDKVKGAEEAITTVYVTSDADTVTRIKKIAEGISEGKPVSSFGKELEEIGRRITPNMQ